MTAFLAADLVLAALLTGFFAAPGLDAAFLTTVLSGDGRFATTLSAAAFLVGAAFAGAFFTGAFFTATFFDATFLVGAAFFADVFAGAFLAADFFAVGFAEVFAVDLLELFTFLSLVAADFAWPALTAASADVSLLRAFAPVELALLFAISLHRD